MRAIHTAQMTRAYSCASSSGPADSLAATASRQALKRSCKRSCQAWLGYGQSRGQACRGQVHAAGQLDTMNRGWLCSSLASCGHVMMAVVVTVKLRGCRESSRDASNSKSISAPQSADPCVSRNGRQRLVRSRECESSLWVDLHAQCGVCVCVCVCACVCVRVCVCVCVCARAARRVQRPRALPTALLTLLTCRLGASLDRQQACCASRAKVVLHARVANAPTTAAATAANSMLHEMHTASAQSPRCCVCHCRR
jgi:hypothetical protein